MTHSRMSLALLPLLVVALTVCAAPATEQSDYSNPNMTPTNNLPNPFSERQLMALPDGRTWGSTAGADAAKGRDDIWAIDRCGSNGCVDSDLDPLMHYDANGNLIGRMGANLFAFPHGIHVDQQGNVWVTDPLPPDGRGAGGDVGQQVTKLSPSGEILLQLGTLKVTGNGPQPVQLPVRRRRRERRRHLRGRWSWRGHERAHHEVRQRRGLHLRVGQAGATAHAERVSSRASTR